MLGIITKNLLSSQLNYEVFRQLNSNHEKFNGVLISRNLTKNFYPTKFPILNYSKIFSGHLDANNLLIATDLDSALTLSNVQNKAKKIFYVWELEFLRNKDFNRNYEIYKQLPIYTRSYSYKMVLENYCNKEVFVKEFNLEKLWNTLMKK